MILVHGRDELVGQIARHLAGLHHEAAVLDAHDDVFEAVIARGASAVVGVADPGIGREAPCTIVDDLVRASHAPKPPVVVLVSDLASDDPRIRRLKRSGAAYVLIPRGTERRPPASWETVWLSRAVASEPAGNPTTADVLDAVAGALRDDAPVGVIIAPRPSAWRAFLAESPAKVREVPNWVARLAGMCGRPAVYRDRNRVISQLEAPAGPWWRQTLRLPSPT